jgi:hypothetical protein
MKGADMIVHRVVAFPEEGQHVRCKCGHKSDNPKVMALTRASVPEGADLCRKCWRDDVSTTDRGKLKLIDLIARSAVGGVVPQADLIAILEDRYYPEDRRSPKAA